ncbi:fimbria/pilus outer membrane usher protein [Rahnella inusitata]|uniref:fimbria/pilus outer membrane usher protein n=2 Tax=Enterobacterales TaxID=91347 RepID=UPI0039AFE478
MTVRLLKAFRFSHLSLCLLFIACMNRTDAASVLPEGALPQYLAVSVNQQAIPGFVEMWQDGNDFWLKVEDARKLQIDISDLEQKEGLVRLRTGDYLKLEYDALNQSLLLTVSGDELTGKTVLDGTSQNPLQNDALTPSVSGLTLNYSLYGQKGSGYETVSALTELRSTGGEFGVFSSGLNSRLLNSEGRSSVDTERLDTRWTYSNPEKRISVIAGDGYTEALSWGRRVRYGGLTITRDYSLQPSVNTGSRSVLTDSVTLPSTVDLYVNGIKNSSQQVSPGQFALSTTPTFTGGGMAEVVITDINGRKRMVSLDVYGTQNILAGGYHTESFSLGWLRENYAETSFDYNSHLLLSGAWRYGVNNNLTLEAHTQMAQGRLMLGGAGLSWLTSPWTGIISLNAAGSQYEGAHGQQSGFGWQWNRGGVGFSVSHQQYSGNYCDLACLAGSQQQKKSDSIWLTTGTDSAGNFGLGVVEQQYPSTGRSRYGSISWTKTLDGGLTLSVSASRMITGDERQTLFYSGLSIPLGTRYRVSLQADRQNGTTGTQWQLTSLADRTQPDWGWQISSQQGKSNLFHAEVNRTAMTHEWQAGTDVQRGEKGFYASLDGTLGWLGNHLYAMRNVPDAFAVVDTNGVPDIPVKLHNNPAGRTDEQGYLLLTDLNGWLPNQIAIDPLSLPGDYRAPETVATVVPRAGSGVSAHFNVYRARAVVLKLKNTSGADIDVGSAVTVLTKDGTSVASHPAGNIVGYNGDVYLENPPEGGQVEVHTPSGQCVADIPDMASHTKTIEQAEVVCH